MAYVEPIKIAKRDVQEIVNATFPSWRGRKIAVQPKTSVTFQNLNWSGGSRSQYAGCTITGQASGNLSRFNAMAPWDPRQVEGRSVDLPPGFLIVEHIDFCGKDLGLRIYCNPADMPKLLPSPQV